MLLLSRLHMLRWGESWALEESVAAVFADCFVQEELK